MLHYFNPGHEIAVLNASPYYTARKSMLAMCRDLAFLPAWYADKDDFVIVDKSFNKEYYAYLTNSLGKIATAIASHELGSYSQEEVELWGISPQAIHYFTEINKVSETNLRLPEWNDAFRYLNSRQAAKDCLEELIKSIPQISSLVIPRFYSDLKQLEEDVEKSSRLLLAKAPYSSSGRGLLWIPSTGISRTERQILHGIFKKQGSVSLEVVLDRQLDFAMEFMSDGKGNILFAGYSLFYTSEKGAYLGNFLGSQQHIENILSEKIPLSLLEKVKERLMLILSDKYAHCYKGCIGVDMMTYKENNNYFLHPCVEINMRYNMGFLALQLSRNYISPSSQGRFYIDFSASEGETYRLHQEMKNQYPAQFSNQRLTSGYLALCPIEIHSYYRAYMLIENQSTKPSV